MSTITQPTQQDIQEVVNPYLGENTGFAIGVASPQFDPPGDLFYLGSILDYKQNSMTLNEDTYFEIASNTKIFTAALLTFYPDLWNKAVGSYHPRGKPSLPASFNNIKLLNLANYTSGLPKDNKAPNDQPRYLPQPYNMLSLYSFLHDGNVAVSGTGTTYTYSNLGFSLLARTIPIAKNGKGVFKDLVRRVITEPLGLKSTKLFTEVPVTKLPLGISNNQIVRSGWPEFPAYFGAGGLVSTPKDMMTWLRFNMGMISGSELNSLLKPMQTPSTSVKTGSGEQLGIGWFIVSIPAICGGQHTSLPVIWKDGGLSGYSSFVTFLQSSSPGETPSQAGVFVLTNSTCPEVAEIAFKILRMMNGCNWIPSQVFSINHQAR